MASVARTHHDEPVEVPASQDSHLSTASGKSWPAELKIVDYQGHKLIVFNSVEKPVTDNNPDYLPRMTSSIVQSMIVRDLALVKHQSEVGGVAGKIGLALGLCADQRAIVHSAHDSRHRHDRVRKP